MVEKSDHIVDAVITWVNGNDPSHKAKMQHYLKENTSIGSKSLNMRFTQINEIEFTVKSILKYANFVRNIFIVTDNQIPDFLKNKKDASVKYPNVHVIDHKVIFKEYTNYLPTFNSLAIETMLYKIPNLAEQFIYFNDDFILANETTLEDFFINKTPVLRGNWRVFYDNIWHKKIKNFYNKFFKKEVESKYKHHKGLQKPAEFLNFKTYFFSPHVPSPQLKLDLKVFFEKNTDILVDNIKFKFRHAGQFVASSLSNHLQIKKENYIHKKNEQLIYFQNYKKPLWWLMYKFTKIEKNKNIKFLCLQSLDQCPNHKLEVIKKWLYNRYN